MKHQIIVRYSNRADRSLPPVVQAPAPLSSFLFRRRSKFPAAPAADASAVTLTADRRSVVLYLVPSLKFLFIFS